MDIRGLVKGFRTAFDPESINDRNRLVEAFETLDADIKAITAGSGSNKFYTKAYSSAALAIPTGVPTALQFNAEISQNGGMHSSTTLNQRFTIQRAGLYSIFANIQWPLLGAASPLTLQVKVNGATIIASVINDSPIVAAPQDQSISTGEYFNIGDYIEIFVTQATGGPINIPVVAAYSPYVMVMEN